MSEERQKKASIRFRIDPYSKRGSGTRIASIKQKIRTEELAAIPGESLLCKEAKSMNVSSHICPGDSLSEGGTKPNIQ
jgi:hypothetical protein